MKSSYFGFGSPQQQVDMHARSKNTLIFLLFLIYFTTRIPEMLGRFLKFE